MMNTQSRINKVLTLAVVAMAIIGLTTASASAGYISYVPITGDADSGISADNTYTHAIDFGNQPTGGGVATVNGVIFANGSVGDFPAIGESSQTVGTGSSTMPNNHGGDAAADAYLTDGGMRELVHDMIYNDPTTVITLTGLSSRTQYRLRLYHRSWGGTRPQDIGFDTNGVGTDITGTEDTAVFFEDDATQPDPSFATATQVYAFTYDYALSPGVTTLTVYINQTGTGTYHLYGLTNQVFDAMQPSPYDGETVSAGYVDLSWKNLPPNDPSDPNDPGSVWVDVWFGTDPNDLTGIDYTKVVDAGENTTTVQVYAPVIGGTYYWQVDSYLNGSPTGDPNVGDVWTFYAADLPPSVDAGDDMITWPGEPVALDATIEDDGHSTLSYILWSAEPVDGTEVVFDPVTADVEDPIVTITKVPYSTALIVNAGFESLALADGDEGPWGNHAGWGWFGADTGAAVFNPGLPGTDYPAYGGNAPEGQNVVWVNGVSAIAQVLAETLAADTTYTLTVNVGVNSYYPTSTYKVELVAGGSIDAGTDEITGGTVLAEDDNSISLTPDVFATSTVTYDSTGVDAGLVGEALQIRLWCTKHINDDGEANFDNVQLTADPPFPPFTGVQTVTLTLSTSDAANPTPVEDTMTIDVYANNCLAAKGAGVAAIDTADIDANCITDLEDFAEMALTWLVDYTLTEPAPKP